MINKFIHCDILQNIVFETINDKLFITGTIPTGQANNDWAEDLKDGVAFGCVSNYDTELNRLFSQFC